MNSAKFYDLRAAAITFMAFLLLPLLILTLLTLIIWVGNLLFGNIGFFEILGMLLGMLRFMFQLIGDRLAVSGILFATYFGVRVWMKPCFGQVEAAVVALVTPLISIVAVDLYHSPLLTLRIAITRLVTIETFVGLLASFVCVLFCRHVLVRADVLCRQEATS